MIVPTHRPPRLPGDPQDDGGDRKEPDPAGRATLAPKGAKAAVPITERLT